MKRPGGYRQWLKDGKVVAVSPLFERENKVPAPIVAVGGDLDAWGLIASFLNTDDPRPAKEQLDAHYGWRPFEGFKLDLDNMSLTYGEGDDVDPPLSPVSVIFFRQEKVILYPHAWVMVMQPDRSWEICRMD